MFVSRDPQVTKKKKRNLIPSSANNVPPRFFLSVVVLFLPLLLPTLHFIRGLVGGTKTEMIPQWIVLYERQRERKKRRRRRRRKRKQTCLLPRLPNQQRTLNKLPTELRCRNFANNHRLGAQICAKRAKTCVQSVYVLRTSFHFACHRRWLGGFVDCRYCVHIYKKSSRKEKESFWKVTLFYRSKGVLAI